MPLSDLLKNKNTNISACNAPFRSSTALVQSGIIPSSINPASLEPEVAVTVDDEKKINPSTTPTDPTLNNDEKNIIVEYTDCTFLKIPVVNRGYFFDSWSLQVEEMQLTDVDKKKKLKELLETDILLGIRMDKYDQGLKTLQALTSYFTGLSTVALASITSIGSISAEGLAILEKILLASTGGLAIITQILSTPVIATRNEAIKYFQIVQDELTYLEKFDKAEVIIPKPHAP